MLFNHAAIFPKEHWPQGIGVNGWVTVNGQKMSKSLGNGIDPLDMVEKYSADAVRFSLIALSAEGQDINLAENDFELGRNFSNKVWNAFRFLWMQIDEKDIEQASIDFIRDALDTGWLDLADKWILSRYQKVIKKVTRSLETFKLHESHEAIYNFFWRHNEFPAKHNYPCA